MELERHDETRWDLIDESIKSIKKLLSEKRLTFGERFLVSDILNGEFTREWNTTLMADWFHTYTEERKVNITRNPPHYQ